LASWGVFFFPDSLINHRASVTYARSSGILTA
jgi:hypothetical protein